MTPGLRVVAALKAAGFEIYRPFSPASGITEIAQIIERESGITELIRDSKALVTVCKFDDILPHVQGHVAKIEKTILKVSGTDEL